MRKQIVNGLTAAVLMAGFATAAPVSIDFNVGTSATHSGEPDNAAGLTLPGQVGAWNGFTVQAIAGAQSKTTTQGPTFTINPAGGGPGFYVYNQISLPTYSNLRGDIVAMNGGSHPNPVPWALTGLVPNGKYSLIFFQRIGYEGAYTTIDGVGLGSTEPTEKDYDFTDVVADGAGRISGTFRAPTGAWYSFSGLQFEQTGIAPPDTTPPTFTALSPTNTATGVLPMSDLVITFSEAVQKGSGNIVIQKSAGGAFETIPVSSGSVTVNGAAVTINPGTDLAANTGYYVEIDNGAIKDLSGNDFAGISGSGTWSFTSGKVPTVVSIDFDSDNVVFSGEPTHAVGITIPGQFGPWYKLSTAGSPGSPTIATPRGTFTFNTTGAAYYTYRGGDGKLRNDFFFLDSGVPGPITWTLTGLTPGATYDIICYGQYQATAYYVGAMSITGYNDGNPVTRETSGSEGDWNFPGVVADAAGTITGTFAWQTGTSYAVFGGIQFDKVADPPLSGTVFLIR